uniref:Uncharacterized protein n=1 Tax=Lygus hesperus TaxID=30085 RepID=A0A0K8SVT9_LYGHE
MSLGVSIGREQNAVSKNFCGNDPHFGDSHQSTNSILDPVGYADHEESSLHTHPGQASQYFTRQHSSSLIRAKTSQSRTPNKYESDYVTWYSDDNIAVNQTGYETQGFTEYGKMMPPYYASERKYIELWVQCPGQPGIDSCEHLSQPICYTECYEPATNSRESLDWENNEWVYEDGSSRNANTQVCCLGSSENHEEQQYGEFHIDCELSNSKTCDSLSFNVADIQNWTEESLHHVTADTKYEEVEARMLNSEFNGRVDNGEITEHVTESVSFSSESIKIEVLNRKSSLDFSQILDL